MAFSSSGTSSGASNGDSGGMISGAGLTSDASTSGTGVWVGSRVGDSSASSPHAEMTKRPVRTAIDSAGRIQEYENKMLHLFEGDDVYSHSTMAPCGARRPPPHRGVCGVSLRRLRVTAILVASSMLNRLPIHFRQTNSYYENSLWNAEKA